MNSSVDTPVTRPLSQGFRLGTVSIDPRAGEAAGPGGCEKLDPKVVDVLLLLAQNARQVVLREELLARVWPNTVVTDDVLSRCIYELRKQLRRAGGSEHSKDIIETVPKRGYRLNGEVTIPPTRAASLPEDRRAWRSLAAIAAVVAVVWLSVTVSQRGEKSASPSTAMASAVHSIAVLPFLDMSSTQDQRYLSDGIAEEILNQLSQSNDLRVIARTSSFSFREKPVDIPEIAGRLNVSHVLEGSVRRSGDKVRITAQLIEASSNSHVWSKTYTHPVDDLFSVEDAIANSVAAALKITLASDRPKGELRVRAEAYDSFLQAEYFYYRRSPGDNERSISHYEDAVSASPDYARAWAALAGAYSMQASNGMTVDKALRRQQGEAARKAVQLDPQLGLAHARLSQFYYETGDFKKSDEHHRQAVALDPDDPIVLGHMSSHAMSQGDIAGALALQQRAVDVDPLNTVTRQNLGVLLIANGQLDEAMSEYRAVLDIRTDAGPDIEIEIARILVLQGRYEEARSAAGTLPSGKYRDQALALLYRSASYRADANAALERLATDPGEIMDVIRLAEVYAFRGMNDEAFATLQDKKTDLEREPDLGSAWAEYLKTEARVSPFLKLLHADSRWTAFTGDPR